MRKAQVERPRSDAEIRDLRAYMRNYILDYHPRFEESRRHFFMVDRFPENHARFNLVHTGRRQARNCGVRSVQLRRDDALRV